jgi:hypothetical protein
MREDEVSVLTFLAAFEGRIHQDFSLQPREKKRKEKKKS